MSGGSNGPLGSGLSKKGQCPRVEYDGTSIIDNDSNSDEEGATADEEDETKSLLSELKPYYVWE